ncbi:MAG: hypothetical protein QM779_09100 [Propionicimonas sp.]|uniref:hypothetical protein n=1 Tax=Propionicimonas sp. TaxID=1955623 RepID=UPI003D10900B
MTNLIDDTQLLLAVRPDAQLADEDALVRVSEAVVTRASLRAKAQAYDLRITRTIAIAANDGAPLAELAEAAGMSQDEVRERLAAHSELLTPLTRERLVPPARRRRW